MIFIERDRERERLRERKKEKGKVISMEWMGQSREQRAERGALWLNFSIVANAVNNGRTAADLL